MVLVDGWLTKLSAPIVRYHEADTNRIRPVWDILVEEYAYAFAMLTLAMACWDRLGAADRMTAVGVLALVVVSVPRWRP